MISDDSMELEEESKYQEYKDIVTIGAGKFATVHRAQHEPSGIWVALKKVQIFENITSTNERHEVVREAKLLQKLDHPNIIKCYDSWIEHGEFYVSLELCEHGDLETLVQSHQRAGTRVHPTQVWKITLEIAEALNHMMARKLMHRDIKPANVFVDENGSIKLGDLGLGKSFSSSRPDATSVVGTPYYMAPEVMNGSPYSYPADIWSLGCVAYELCNLRSPFYEKNSSLYVLFNKIKGGKYPPVDPAYGPGMQHLMNIMIILEPEKRATLPEVLEFAYTQLQETSQ
jgi:serine/threonine protein kinase